MNHTERTAPRAWTPDELRRGDSWIQRLSPDAVTGFEAALAHAKSAGKDRLSMTAADFPLNDAAADSLRTAFAATQTGYGLCLVKGFPVERWSVDDARLAYWGIGLHVGVARPQNMASEVMNDVRDAGGSYKTKNGRGYNTNAGLDFHIDSCDVVALLCLQTAKSGGTSMVTSSIAVVEETARARPDLIPVLMSDFHHSFGGAGDPSQPPYYAMPIIGNDPAHFAFRANRKNTTAAYRDFSEIPPLSPKQVEALDYLDETLPDPRFCYSMELDRGDMQLVNNYVVIHSRTNFEDFDEPERKRHLLRLWLDVPQSTQLPEAWRARFPDVRAGAVRGGFRGSCITPEFLAFEARQARAMGMKLGQAETVTV